MQMPIISVIKPIKHLVSVVSRHPTAQAVATFVSHNVIAISVAGVVIVGGSAVGVVNLVNHGNKTTTQTQQNKPTTEKTDPDAPTIIVKDPLTGEVKAVSQNDIARNPNLMSNVIKTPTASDYQNAGIAPPASISSSGSPSSSNYLQQICSTTPTPYFYGTGAQADDYTLYCPSFDAYCHYQNNMTSSFGCRTIKPDAPAVTSWTTYTISTSTGKTVSDWVQVSQTGARKCTLDNNFWFDKTGSTTPPAGWYLPVGILGFYHWWDAVPAAYGFCTYEKRMYTTHSINSQDDLYDGNADGRVSIYTPYTATWKSYTFDSMRCTKYRVNWEPFQRTDKSWWSAYRVYEDKIDAALVAGGYTYNNDLCKQLFDGSIIMDTTTSNWKQFAADEYLNIGKQTFVKTIDTVGSRTESPPK